MTQSKKTIFSQLSSANLSCDLNQLIPVSIGMSRVRAAPNSFEVSASSINNNNTNKKYHCLRMSIAPYPTVCVHPPDRDVYISRQLINNGTWEPIIVEKFLKVLRTNPDVGVIDLGANIGVYSLLAAKMRHDVIAVEPYSENVARLLTAATVDNTTQHITILQNAVSDHCGIAAMYFSDANQGDIRVSNSNYVSDLTKHNASCLTLSCLQTFTSFPRAVLKVDIQGNEHRALLSLPQLLQTVDVICIFMEWSLLRTYHGSDMEVSINKTLVNDLVVMLQDDCGYIPFSSISDKRLKIAFWYGWPDDVIWRREP